MIAPQRHEVHKGHAYQSHCFEPVAPPQAPVHDRGSPRVRHRRRNGVRKRHATSPRRRKNTITICLKIFVVHEKSRGSVSAYPKNRILSSAQRPRTGAARIEGAVFRGILCYSDRLSMVRRWIRSVSRERLDNTVIQKRATQCATRSALPALPAYRSAQCVQQANREYHAPRFWDRAH